MTEALRRAIAQIEHLPEAAQDEAAAKIQTIAAELANQSWDELLQDSRSDTFFDHMLTEIEAERNKGTLRPWPSPKDAQA